MCRTIFGEHGASNEWDQRSEPDPGTLIRDFDADIARLALGAHLHASALGTELDRVDDEVHHRLPELDLVYEQRRQAVLEARLEPDAVLLCEIARRLDGSRQH